MSKESSTNDEVMGPMELKKERFARIQGAEKLRRARLREIEFVNTRPLRQKGEPAIVCSPTKAFMLPLEESPLSQPTGDFCALCKAPFRNL